MNKIFKYILLGTSIYFLGFLVSSYLANFFTKETLYSYLYGIFFAILFLASVVGVSVAILINEIRNKKTDS